MELIIDRVAYFAKKTIREHQNGDESEDEDIKKVVLLKRIEFDDGLPKHTRKEKIFTLSKHLEDIKGIQ